jgi:hypothetical protein
MISAIEDFFSSFVTRIVRYPNSNPDKSPVLIAIEERPIAGTFSFRWLPNEGQHFRAFLLIQPKARLKASVKRHFEEYMNMYLGDRKDEIERLVTHEARSRQCAGHRIDRSD